MEGPLHVDGLVLAELQFISYSICTRGSTALPLCGSLNLSLEIVKEQRSCFSSMVSVWEEAKSLEILRFSVSRGKNVF